MAWTRAGSGAIRAGITFAACVGLVAMFCARVAAAQPSIENLPLTAAYGDGVHAYFAGDYQRAYEDLTQAIEAGSNDPRAFYFRGLAALRQGRGDEAEADFTAGADRESQGLGTWPVARSLERIQGADRLRLERHRMRARVANLQRQREAERLRYSQIEAAQPDVLRRRRPVAPRGGDDGNVFEEQPGPAERPEPMPEPAPAAEPAEPDPAEPEDAAPAGDDGAAGSSKTEQVEQLAAEREDGAAQRDQQQEAGAAEAENTAAQADQQAEQEAAAGDQ